MPVVRAPVVTADGRIGVRGWRALDGQWLGPVRETYWKAHHDLSRYRGTKP